MTTVVGLTETVLVGPGWDDVEDEMIADERLRDAFQCLWDACDWWRPIWEDARCSIRFNDFPSGHALFNFRSGGIEIAERFRESGEDVLAALISHESVHAYYHYNREFHGLPRRRSLEEFVAEEIEALTIELQVWETLCMNTSQDAYYQRHMERRRKRIDEGVLETWVRETLSKDPDLPLVKRIA